VTANPKYLPIRLGSPGEDISRKDLQAIIQRFKNLNHLRQQRVQDFLQQRQQIFLNLLPLLFHQNHPLLPGFISSETVAGIPDYHPNKTTILTARQFSKGFKYQRKALLNYPIHGIFLMGSVSSIAFSKVSDMDIWLCHQPNLTATEIEELQQKAESIERWADSFDLEVHFFLVNSQEFIDGYDIPISSESSGTTQHYLLLEEFYRTAIYIAGRVPAWWLVPPHQEHNYTGYMNHLLENRFVFPNEVIDFGGLEDVPAEEFVSSTLWHIYKSLNSPHKSLLKLFLMECYASEYPHTDWLSFTLKKAIYDGDFDIDRLDPYLLIYDKIEKYLLKSRSHDRLELVRQCFYLKIIGSSSRVLDYQSRIIRENYLEQIAEERQWPADLLPSLNSNQFWNILKATQEHDIIRKQLKHCLRMVLDLSSQYIQYNYRENQDLKLITRKLHAFLERKPEKIELITTRFSVHNKENELSIVETSSQQDASIWSLYLGRYEAKKPNRNALIKQELSLISLLGWLVINGLYQKNLLLHLTSNSVQLSHKERHDLINQMHKFLEAHILGNKSLDIYNKPDKICATLLMINLGHTLSSNRNDGMMVVSDRSDPLSYGKNRDCFIEKVDQISVSLWGEVTTSTHYGLIDFFTCLTKIFNASQSVSAHHEINMLCYLPTRANSILLRAEEIYNNLIRFFGYQQKQNYRYFLPGGNAVFVFQRQFKQLQFWQVETQLQLIQELGVPQEQFCISHFDPGALEDPIITTLYGVNQPQTIQVFYIEQNGYVIIYILDEKGSLFTQKHTRSNHEQVLTNYSVFLESLENHPFYEQPVSLQYYELQENTTGCLSLHPAQWYPSKTSHDINLQIQTSDSLPTPNTVFYRIFCNDIEFNSLDYSDNVFQVVRNHIRNCRANKEDYPIHVTDIEAPCHMLGAETDNQLQTIHFLEFKKKIEARLNS
jgi:adenylate cyclase class 1